MCCVRRRCTMLHVWLISVVCVGGHGRSSLLDRDASYVAEDGNSDQASIRQVFCRRGYRDAAPNSLAVFATSLTAGRPDYK